MSCSESSESLGLYVFYKAGVRIVFLFGLPEEPVHSEVVAHRTAREGNEAHAGKGKPPMDGAYGQPVVADEDDVIQDDQQYGPQKLHAADLPYAGKYLFEAVALELVIQEPAGQKTYEEYEELAKDGQEFFHRSAVRN